MTNGREMLFASGQAEPSRAPRSLRILVCDDDSDAALTLMMILRDEGHEVTAVHAGRNVLNAVIRGTELDAIVLDINLPDVSGWQVAQTIRARGTNRPLMIGISGVYKTGADMVLATVSGFDHYLVKPCAPADLLKLLEPLRIWRK
jgi:DNA-binding response OmpR family regulator